MNRGDHYGPMPPAPAGTTMRDVDPAERIELIKEAATLLAKREWPELDLILEQYGIPTADEWTESTLSYCYYMIKQATDEQLRGVHRYLVGETSGGGGPQPWTASYFKLFMSHLAIHQEMLGEIREFLHLEGYSRG